MIRINFCKTGASVSDWDIDDTVAKIKRISKDNGLAPRYHYSNFLLLDAIRAEIAEGKISLDDIVVSIDDVYLQVFLNGTIERSYPEEGLTSMRVVGRILRAQKNHGKEKEASSLDKNDKGS